jgi:hypothetical protein
VPALIQTGAPAERNVVSWRTVDPVGVGFPNPSDEATLPLPPNPYGRGDLSPTTGAMDAMS